MMLVRNDLISDFEQLFYAPKRFISNKTPAFMKTVGILFVLLFTAWQGVAQTLKLQALPHKISSTMQISTRLEGFTDSECIISDYKSGDGYLYSIYDAASLEKTSEFILPHPYIDGKLRIWYQNIFRGDEITTLYSLYTGKNDRFALHGRVMNRSGNVVDSGRCLMAYTASSRFNLEDIHYRFSADGLSLLLYRLSAVSDDSQRVLFLKVFDRHLNLRHEQALRLKGEAAGVKLEAIGFADAQRITAVFSSVDAADESRAHFSIYRIETGTGKVGEKRITHAPFYLKQCAVSFSGNSDAFLQISGFYSNIRFENRRYARKQMDGINALFWLQFDMDGFNLEKEIYQPLTIEDIKQVMHAGAKIESDHHLADRHLSVTPQILNLRHLASRVLSDGAMVLSGEIAYFKTHYSLTGVLQYTYYTEALAEFRLESDGRYGGMRCIGKRQISRIPYRVGALMLDNHDTAIYVYADNARNLDPEKLARQNSDPFKQVMNDFEKPRPAYAFFRNGMVLKFPLVSEPAPDSANTVFDPVYDDFGTDSNPKRAGPLLDFRNYLYYNERTVFIWGAYRGKSLLYRLSID